MIIYNDLFTGRTILSDSYRMELVDDFVYVVKANYASRKGDKFGDELFCGNPSAEEVAEEIECGGVLNGFDVIINHDDVEEWSEEPNYLSFVKNVMKPIVAAAGKKLDKEKHNVFKQKLSTFFKTGRGNKECFKNFQIFFSKDCIDPKTGDILAAPILVDADDTGMKGVAYYFKDLMVEEKM